MRGLSESLTQRASSQEYIVGEIRDLPGNTCQFFASDLITGFCPLHYFGPMTFALS